MSQSSVTSAELFAITPPGVELITATELRALGMTPTATERGGVTWQGGIDDVYRANLHLRTANRIVVRAAAFRATTFFELERRAKRVPWREYVVAGRPVRFRVTCRKSRLYHSGAVAQRLSEAVAPVVGDAALVGVATGDDEHGVPDAQLFIVRVDHDQVTISADASGVLLHRRGYRQAVAKAPLRETLAAAMLLASGWNCRAPLIDPMCGSGTIAIEGAMLARNMAPGARRRFAFMGWPGFDPRRWGRWLSEAREGELARVPGVIRASDRDAGAIQATMENAERAEVAGDIDISERALSAVEGAGARGWLLTNPPYGVRVGDTSVRNLYAQFGKVIRMHFLGWHIGMLSADPAMERQMRMRFERSFGTSNGGIPVRFVTAVANPGDEEG
jgi:putative N6-adenine-specific DNA methylase